MLLYFHTSKISVGSYSHILLILQTKHEYWWIKSTGGNFKQSFCKFTAVVLLLKLIMYYYLRCYLIFSKRKDIFTKLEFYLNREARVTFHLRRELVSEINYIRIVQIGIISLKICLTLCCRRMCLVPSFSVSVDSLEFPWSIVFGW